MQKQFPSNFNECIPFYIGDGPSITGSRIGGIHPDKILPSEILSTTRYFATFQIAKNPIVEISIFLNFDFDIMYDNSGIVHYENNLVNIITHGESVRATNEDVISDISPHPIVFKNKINDNYIDNDIVIPYPHHKMWGRAYTEDFDLKNKINKLEKEKYFHLLQIAFPDDKDGDVDGDWPFANGTLNIFSKKQTFNEFSSYIYCWEY